VAITFPPWTTSPRTSTMTGGCTCDGVVSQSVWQSLFERNERIKLQQEHQAVTEDAQRQREDAQRQREEVQRLKERVEQERRRVEEAESSARCVLFLLFHSCWSCLVRVQGKWKWVRLVDGF